MYKLSLAIGAACVLAVVLIAVVVVRLRPLIWLSMRGPRRRPVESGLAALGIALGASLTVGALALGASLEASVAQMKQNRLGPIDVVFTFRGSQAKSEAVKLNESLPRDQVAGSLVIARTEGSVGIPGAEIAAPPLKAEPDVVFIDLDFEQAKSFAGDDPSKFPATGPDEGEVFVTSELADLLGTREGETVLLGLPRGRYPFRVGKVLEAKGLAGYGGPLDEPAKSVWVPRNWLGAQPHETQLLVSLAGGEGSLDDRSRSLFERLAPVTSEFESPKPSAAKVGAEIEQAATSVGDLMRRQLLQLGSFAGAASLALVIAIFAMVVADRRREIGILRATGMKRVHASAEMAQEAVILGVIGAAAGVGLGMLVAAVGASAAKRTLVEVLGAVDFAIVADLEPIVIGAGGAFLAGIIAALSGTRRWLSMPPAAALRVVEEQGRPVKVMHLVAGVAAMVFGVATAATDLKYRTSTFSYLGPPIAVAGLALVLYQTQWAYVAMLVAAVASAAWLVGIDIAWGGKAASEGVFVTFGMAVALVVAGAIAFGILAPMIARVITRILAALNWSTVTGRLAAANLASSRGQAGFTVATCALVVLMPASIATVSAMEQTDRERVLWNQTGGWSAMIESRAADESSSSFEDRIKNGPLGGNFEQVAELPKSRITVHLVGAGSVSTPFYATSPELASAALAPGGNDSGAMLPLTLIDRGFEGESAAWDSLFEDHEDGAPRVIVTFGVLPAGIDLRGAALRVGDTGKIVKIAGVAHRNSFMPGVFIAPEKLAALGVKADRRNALALLPKNAEAESIGLEFQGLYFGEGARMIVASDQVERQLKARALLAELLQSFLSVGLIVGIASLAVVIARSVRSRRHEIAVLRAIGVSRRGVAWSVIGQSLGLTTSGVGLGVLLGGYIGGRIFLAMSAGGEAAVPWATLSVVFLIVVAVTSAGAAAPAIAAARLAPAKALSDSAN